MKVIKIIYWISTVVTSAGMFMSGTMYLTSNPKITQGFALLGYPPYVVYLLGALKVLGSIVLLIPHAGRLKEWAYAGFCFCFIGAIWSHVATHTPFIAPVMFLLILLISYLAQTKMERKNAGQTKWAAA